MRALTDGAGAVVQTYRYDEYGVLSSSAGSVSQPFGFTGEQGDPETGLLYLRARFYDAGSGRFASRDPFGGLKAEPLSLHRYAYVRSNPVASSDPTGLACIGPLGGGTAAAGLGTFGGAGTASEDLGACAGGPEGANAGVIAQAGYFINGLYGEQIGEQATGGNTAIGAFVGIGAGGFVSNATTLADLEGPFDTTSLDVSAFPFPYKFSFQLAYSGDIWMASLTFGAGEGMAASRFVTRTKVLWTTQNRKK